MQQSQIVGISIRSGSCGGKITYIDIKKEGGQDRSLGDAISQTSKPASLAINSGQGKASMRQGSDDGSVVTCQ